MRSKNIYKYFVSRQIYYGIDLEDGQMTVEVAKGGLDYANADMLVSVYRGEGEEYDDPREAAKVAISICEQWKNEQPYVAEFIGVAHGFTLGYSFPFEHVTFDELIEWANIEYESLPKCARCDEVFDPEHGYSLMWQDEYVYCSDYCCDKVNEEIEILNMLDIVAAESTSDKDDVWVIEGNTWINPTEEEINRYQLQYAGTVGYVKARFHQYLPEESPYAY